MKFQFFFIFSVQI